MLSAHDKDLKFITSLHGEWEDLKIPIFLFAVFYYVRNATKRGQGELDAKMVSKRNTARK